MINKKKLKITCPIGILLSLFLILGRQIDKFGELRITVVNGIAIIFASLIITVILIKLYDFLDYIEAKEKDSNRKRTKKEKIFNYMAYYFIMLDTSFFSCVSRIFLL